MANSGDVVRLVEFAPPVDQTEPDERLLRMFEEALEKARAGQIKAAAVQMLYNDDLVADSWVIDVGNANAMIGIMHRSLWDLTKKASE